MKTHLFPILAGTAFAVLAFCPPAGSLRAQAPQSALKLELVTPQSESFALGHISGKPLHATNQEQLGAISDFLIDPKTGQVPFAMVPSGAGASGQTYRLVPMSVIDPSRGPDALGVRLARDQWDRVGTMTEQELQGSIRLNTDQEQRLAQQFGGAALNANQPMEGLVRASTLKGREIRGGNDSFGTVEDVVIDFNNKIAAPMLKLNTAIAGVEQKFLVPFDRLQGSETPQNAITTNLNRWDFQQLLRGQAGLSPTGFPNAPYGQGRQPAFAAVNAVQQALARNQSAAGVQVVPESRLVLRGTVESDQKKAEIEQAANQAAGGVRVDSELTVRRW